MIPTIRQEYIRDLLQKINDLVSANNVLLQRNHEIQADNEELTKEVKEYAKRCDDLRKSTVRQAMELGEQDKTIKELQEKIKYLESSVVGTLETSPKSKFVITVEEF